jgi:hypothetical protein
VFYRVLVSLLLAGTPAALLPCRALAAQDQRASPLAAEVEITVVATEEELARIRGAVAAGDLGGAEASWARAERFERGALLAQESQDSPVIVRAFVVVSPGRASLYFADRRAERFLVREVPLPNGLDSVGTDAVSQVLALSIVALLENAESGLTRAQTEVLLAPEPTTAVSPRAPIEQVELPKSEGEGHSFVAATAYYALRVFGGGVPFSHGPGLRLGWIIEGSRLEGELWASGQYELPLDYETASVGVEWTTVPLRGGATLLASSERASRLKLGASLGAGADLVSFTPRAGSEPAALELAGPDQTAVFVLSLRLLLAYRLGSHFDLKSELSADFYPERLTYAVSENGVPANVLSPWRVRPGLALALTLR